jgi:transglutaminase-like putative cysteine protease
MAAGIRQVHGMKTVILAAVFATLWCAAMAQMAPRRLRFEEAPAPNSTVKGTVNVRIGVDPSFQPAGVIYEILVDGMSVGRVNPPASFAWDTRTVADGKRMLQIVRRIPADGKTFRETFREEVPVVVANGTSTATPGANAGTWAEIDSHALAAPENAEQSIDSLAAYLTQTAHTDIEKTRSIYRWVAGRIRWGPEDGVNPGQPMDARPEAVLSRRTAECLGYARLFEALARKTGLEVTSIQGYVRTDAATADEYAASPARFNHWWNAVKLDGKWKLIDCGWSVRGQDGTTAGSAQGLVHLESHYFLCPPEQLIFTHYPLDPKWQLTDSPLSLDEQKRLPYPRAEFFTLGLGIDSPRTGSLRVDGSVTVRITAPEDVVMAATLSQGGALVSRVNASERQDGRYIFPFTRIAPGAYRLTLFAKKRGESGSYREVLSYTVESR